MLNLILNSRKLINRVLRFAFPMGDNVAKHFDHVHNALPDLQAVWGALGGLLLHGRPATAKALNAYLRTVFFLLAGTKSGLKAPLRKSV